MIVSSIEIFDDGNMSSGENSQSRRDGDPAQRPNQNDKNTALQGEAREAYLYPERSAPLGCRTSRPLLDRWLGD